MRDYDELMKKYPILFTQKKLPMQETCMCWGIECGNGWYEPLDNLCFKLESLNKDYKKYGIQIQAQQVKEKFGGLRFYYNVYFTKSLFVRILTFPFYLCEKFLNELDFDIQFKKEIKEDNDVSLTMVANKHSFLYEIKKICHNVSNMSFFNPSQKRVDKANLISEIADKLIRSAEDDCWNTCEICGEKNNYEKSNIITTSGWIKRICKKCSQKSFEQSTEEFDKNHPEDKYYGINRITLFKEGYWFLNFFSGYKSFEYDGKYYSSISHAFLSLKNPEWSGFYHDLLHGSKENSSYLICDLSKRLGVVPEERDYELLKELVKAKFSDEYAKEIKQDLLDTGDKMLINMNKYCDNVLGVCCCDECKLEKGKNLYGKILMEVRKELFEK